MKSIILNLEEEAIYIIRETIATANNPVVLYSIGKDSSVLFHILKKQPILVKYHVSFFI